MSRQKTRFIGVFFREGKTNGKDNKTYYIGYKDQNQKNCEIRIGKHYEGVRENYCPQKRQEIITKQRLDEELPFVTKWRKKGRAHYRYIYRNMIIF